MEVYVFTTHCVYDFESPGISNDVFSGKEEAMLHFSEWKKAVLKEIAEDGWTVLNNTDDTLEAYDETAGYSARHIEAFVKKHTIISNNLF